MIKVPYKRNRKTDPEGFEPTTFCSEGRRSIHAEPRIHKKNEWFLAINPLLKADLHFIVYYLGFIDSPLLFMELFHSYY